MISRIHIIHMVAIALLTLAGCTTLPREAPPTIVWPLPPAEPRIKYVDYIMGSRDVTGARTSLSKILLFGEEAEVRFTKPSFISAISNTVYVTDIGRLMIFDYNKKTFMQTGTDVLRNPTGVATLSDGRVIVGESSQGKLYAMSPPKYKAVRFAPEVTLMSIGGIAVNEKLNRLYVTDTKNHRIVVTDLSGKPISTIGRRGSERGDFNFPYDVAVGPEDRLYVVDSGNFRVQVFDSDGNFITYFGTVGSQLGAFARPKGIDIDSDGHIYVVDSAFGNFQIFDETGLLYLSVGGTGPEPGMNILPMGIHIDPDDKIYLVDQINRRVQIYQYIRYSDEPKAPLAEPMPKPK